VHGEPAPGAVPISSAIPDQLPFGQRRVSSAAFVDITETIGTKMEAIKSHASQFASRGLSTEQYKEAAMLYGRFVGVRYAEGIEIMRMRFNYLAAGPASSPCRRAGSRSNRSGGEEAAAGGYSKALDGRGPIAGYALLLFSTSPIFRHAARTLQWRFRPPTWIRSWTQARARAEHGPRHRSGGGGFATTTP